MRSKSYLFLLLVLGLGILAGFLYTQKPYKLGLDVKGGIRLTYRMQLTDEQRPRSEEYRQRLIHVLEKRAQGPMGVAEPVIAGKGDDQITVELPGATNEAEARRIISSTAEIRFYHAKNVTTQKAAYRPYTDVDQERSEDPTVSFRRTTGAGVEIKPTDAEYLRIIQGWDLILKGEDLSRAEMKPSGTNAYQPNMFFSPEGARKMEEWSRRYYNQGEKLAAVLDNKVLSVSPVQEGTVLSDNAYINGEFPTAYVRSLVDLLNGGALPVAMVELSSEKIDPTIGNYALDKMILAGYIAFGVTALFLIAYYAFPGFVALLALGIYVLFTITMLKLMNATFSLAAIAGFILSVGMAVDANVLVFERLKEELKAGKSLRTAIELGFKRAFPAILDSNACTILTSLVLLAVGTGPVKGFATTLIVGVIISLFTAITITRSLLTFFVGSGLADNPKWYAADRSWFKGIEERANERPFKIIEKSRLWFIISLASMVIAVPFFFMGGFKLNVEFRGGYEAIYPAAANASPSTIVQNLEKAGYRGANVKLGEARGERRVYITIPPNQTLAADLNKAPETIAQAAGLGTVDPLKTSFTQIGPAIQQETVRNAIIAVIVSSLLIVLYLAFRFGIGFGGFAAGLRFGGAAIGALLHDAVVVLGAAAIVGYILKWEISGLFLTAMLTVIGFSVHDTIVIFDRIRENLHRQRQSEDFGHLINRSVTQSFARSINTSMTVIATLVIMIAIGTPTPDLKFFMLAMLIGILSGTYSSIFNASPILYLWDRAIAAKRGADHSLVGMATKDLARQRVLGTEAATPQVADPSTGRSYGQVKRRANAPQKGHIEIED